MLCEAVDRVFVLVPVEATGVVVSVFLLDDLLLLVIEQLKVGIVVLQPRVLEDFRDGDSFEWVDLQQATEHVSGFSGDVLFECVDASQNEAVELFHTGCLEGHSAVEHSEQDHSS